MGAIDRLVGQLRDRQRADRAALEAAPCASCSVEERLGLTFKPGDRVVDLVTGQRGIVGAGTKETRLVSAP